MTGGGSEGGHFLARANLYFYFSLGKHSTT